jgi:hypothetical protein
MGIRYEDHYLRTPDGWRLAKRVLNLIWQQDLPLDLSLAALASPAPAARARTAKPKSKSKSSRSRIAASSASISMRPNEGREALRCKTKRASPRSAPADGGSVRESGRGHGGREGKLHDGFGFALRIRQHNFLRHFI